MVIMGVFVGLAGVLFVGLMGVYAAYTSGLPPSRSWRASPSNEGSRVVSADGVELATFAAERREVVPYDEIPQLLIDAQVAAEDRPSGRTPASTSAASCAPPCRT